MYLILLVLLSIDKNINLNEAIECPYTLSRMADYPNGPNTDGCEDSVEVRDGVMTWTRFGMDAGFFVTHPHLPLKDRIHIKLHPDFPYLTTMAKSTLTTTWTKPELLPFNSDALNGCQHLNGALYFHQEINGTKTLKKGNIKTRKLENMPFYGDNPNMIDQNTFLIDLNNDIQVAKKGWFWWNIYNATDYFKAPINTLGDDTQPHWCDGKLYFTRNYKEIWMYDPRIKIFSLIAKIKHTIGGIGEATIYNNKLYMLGCFFDGENWDYDIIEGKP